MEHLETQVSDLRAFLPGAPIPPAGLLAHPIAPGAAGRAALGGQAQGHTHAHAQLLSQQQHQHQHQQPHPHQHQHPQHQHQQQAQRHSGGGAQAAGTTPHSALHGPNSARSSPTAATPTTAVGAYPQHADHTQRPGTNRSHGFSASPPAGEAGSLTAASAGAKRRAEASAEEAAQKQQRSKRNRYISIACNECKRRKIKCNGETPCQRCGNLHLQCLYAPNCCANSFRDSDEFKQMSDSLSLLQDQMETLQRNMAALQQETPRLAPLNDRVLPLPTTAASNSRPSPSNSTSSAQRPNVPSFRSPVQFHGPTSASSHVNVAKNTLHNMGYSAAEGNDDTGNAMMGEDTTIMSPLASSFLRDSSRRPADPLWDYDEKEVLRLCRVHEEEVGIMYPVVNIEDVVAHAKFVCRCIEAATRSGMTIPHLGGQGETLTDIKSLELKIIMCCALVVEEHGHSARADRIWDSLQPIADRMMMSDPTDVTNLPFLALVGGYRFLANEEVLAWRVMGQVARLCLEMGLHRRDGISRIEGEQERTNAVNTFWSAYVLDRRWSFGTGFPFAVQDDKIDPELPYPKDYPYLTSLIHLARLSSKIWRLVDYFDSVLIRDLKRDDYENLDNEILEWYDTVPDKIKISNLGNHIPVPGTPTYDIERLQVWTRLRLNQIRIWLYTPVLHTATSMAENSDCAHLVVNLAKETIQYLSLLNNTSEIYRRIQVFYHHFLTSAIAVLFLASTHAPLEFSSQCREQFHMALELVKELSAHSWVSQRLWRTVKSLKTYAPRLGLQREEEPRRGDHAALASSMADSGHDPSHRSSASSIAHQPSPSPSLTTGHGGHQQHFLSRMDSINSHGERLSPHSMAGMHATQGARLSQADDNGVRLQTEMSRVFEDFYTGHLGDYSTGGSVDFTPGEERANLFSSFRDCF